MGIVIYMCILDNPLVRKLGWVLLPVAWGGHHRDRVARHVFRSSFDDLIDFQTYR